MTRFMPSSFKRGVIASFLMSMIFGLVASTAHATTPDPFPQSIIQGNLRILMSGFEGGIQGPSSFSYVDGFDGQAGMIYGFSTPVATGAIVFTDEQMGVWSPECPVTLSVSESAEGDDIVQCAAEIPPVGGGYSESIEVQTQYRVFAPDANGVVLARMLYKVRNTAQQPIILDRISAPQSWSMVNSTWVMQSNTGPVLQGTNANAMPNGLNWLNSFVYSGSTVNGGWSSFGSAWQNAENQYFTQIEGGSAPTISDNGVLENYKSGQELATGQTVYYALFSVYTLPPFMPDSQETQAMVTNSNAFMQVFNGPFVGSILSRGIPTGSNVLNWGTITEDGPTSPPAPNSELADTGQESRGLIGFVLFAVTAGAVLLMVIRPHRQRA